MGSGRNFTLEAGAFRAVLSEHAILTQYGIVREDGSFLDVVLGYDTPEEYLAGENYFGALVGRCANRIAKGAFTLNGRRYTLDQNDRGNCLHSGLHPWHQRIWKTEGVNTAGNEAAFTLLSPDGDQGFPGNLRVMVTYRLDAERGLSIHMQAAAEQDTVCNLTHHSYFNLDGHDAGSILDHAVRIEADQITRTDDALIPDGNLLDLAGTPLDFRDAQPIGARIGEDDKFLRQGGGYDHNYVLRAYGDLSEGDADASPGKTRLAATVTSPKSEVTLEVWTDLPGLQFYSGNYIGVQKGKGGARYRPRCGVALEPQFFPDAVNIPAFDSPVLRAGELYDHWIEYRLILSE